MHPSEVKKFTRYSPFVVMGAVALFFSMILTVITSQQNQNAKSQAAIVNGDYGATLSSSGNIINGSVDGDVIGDNNTISGNVSGCVKGSGNIIGGRVSGTVDGTGNIVTLGAGSGPCVSEQSSLTPTVSLTATPSATIEPSGTITPTLPVASGSAKINVTLLMHGIGNGGDAANPNASGNMNPLHPERTVSVDVYNATNQLIAVKEGTVTFASASGNFKGTVDLGTSVTTGSYTIKIKTGQFLRGIFPGIQNLTSGQTSTIPGTTLISGDINNDNKINIIDYNILFGCYSDLLPAVSCNDADKVRADINDDGAVNQFDYNFFIRELTNIGGQ